MALLTLLSLATVIAGANSHRKNTDFADDSATPSIAYGTADLSATVNEE